MKKTKINGLVKKDDKNKKKIYVLENKSIQCKKKYHKDQMRVKRKKNSIHRMTNKNLK